MFKVDDLKDVFELAATAGTFINELMKIKSNCKDTNKDNAKIKSSGYYAKLASSGYYAKLASSGYSAKLASSGDYAKLASSGYSAQLASSGNYAQLASSGDSAKLASSGYYAKLASSGDSAQLASSGDYAKLASSGNYAQLASSGNSAQLASSGDYAVVAAVGFWSVASAKKGSWITLCEYRVNADDRFYPYFVKTEYVDGEKIKEDTLYGLFDKEFREVIEVDGIQSLLISQRKNVQKIVLYRGIRPSYIFTKDGVSAHGRTVKQAYRDWLFKISPRDMSEYEGLHLDDIKDLNYWAVCYRTITGACSLGTENFIENSKDKLKPQMSLREVITVTEGQYGHNSFKEFFERTEDD